MLCFRPGFTRINLPYFLDEDTLNFALGAVKLLSEHGWKLLPQVGLEALFVKPRKGQGVKCKPFSSI